MIARDALTYEEVPEESEMGNGDAAANSEGMTAVAPAKDDSEKIKTLGITDGKII